VKLEEYEGLELPDSLSSAMETMRPKRIGPPPVEWTPEQDKFILMTRGNYRMADIAKALKRSQHSVLVRYRQLIGED
jgi:hypothetical protein